MMNSGDIKLHVVLALFIAKRTSVADGVKARHQRKKLYGRPGKQRWFPAINNDHGCYGMEWLDDSPLFVLLLWLDMMEGSIHLHLFNGMIEFGWSITIHAVLSPEPVTIATNSSNTMMVASTNHVRTKAGWISKVLEESADPKGWETSNH